ncbi:ankyrin repeat-containing domain protein [Xylaria bambusicola]|uniref:ankyrin repeat-containing domain protein n=1 Tax=Xylaria bambusicola TaxID=326684 RepID=UPI0020080120|nr:ankyrin repeat-containing domain protein [Xylaria bambusicola]KAI0509449.1 ankyrin repeat-containing domain protein [Xylaria bambusicola]
MAERPGKRKRPPLNYDKCRFCRKAKKACTPVQRTWPQKCQRCTELELECSESSRAAGAPTSIPTQPNNQAIDSQLIRDISLRAMWLGRLNCYHKAIEVVLNTQEELFPGCGYGAPIHKRCNFVELENKSYFNDVFPKIFISNNSLAGYLAQAAIGVTYPQYFSPTQICPTTVDRFRENGDIGTALVIQEILLLALPTWKWSLGGIDELSKYWDIFQQTTDRVRITLEREIPAVPPIHYSLLVGEARMAGQHWDTSNFFPFASRFISMKDYLERSLLHVALDLGIMGTESFYNQLKEFATARDILGRRPIHIACSRFREYPAGYILDITTDYDVKDRLGRTALHYASSCGNEYAVHRLIKQGANIDPKDDSFKTPLSWAVEHGHTSVARLLLKSGADANTRDKTSLALLLLAARRGHTEIVQALLEYNADVHRRPTLSRITALHLAASRGHSAIIELLLNNGARVDSRDDNGKTALHLAVENRHINTTEVLLRNGAGVDETDSNGETALIKATSRGNTPIVQELLKNKAAVNIVDIFGGRALIYAQTYGHTHIFQLLRKYLADPDTEFPSWVME